MNETMLLAWSALAGILLGALFFGGLWWTVLRGMASPRPALWFSVSLLLRSGIVLGGFYLVAGNDWQRLLASLVGFAVARLVATRLSRRLQVPAGAAATEAGHAP